MSKCTKGKIEVVIGKFDYHKLCRKDDVEHKDILENIPTEQAIAYLKKIVHRWNAFEDGGLVDELRTACERVTLMFNCQRLKGFPECKENDMCCICFAKAALAKS